MSKGKWTEHQKSVNRNYWICIQCWHQNSIEEIKCLNCGNKRPATLRNMSNSHRNRGVTYNQPKTGRCHMCGSRIWKDWNHCNTCNNTRLHAREQNKPEPCNICK